jgi:hypothetical protein
MIELDSKAEVTEDAERIPVFSIDDTVYTMPAEVKPHVGLRYLWMLKTDGADYAGAWLMEQVLGVDGFKALAGYEPLTKEQFKAIQIIIRDHTLGSVEGEGKDTSLPHSSNGRKKSHGSKNTTKT